MKKIFLFSIVALSMTGCNSDDKGQQIDSRNWQLVWSDEFDGASGDLPDASKWGFDLGTGANGWGNQELQHYTNRPQNIALDGAGNLVITALKENYQSSQYTSARIKTQNLFSQAYGRFEARLISPYGQGIWPAFWLLGANIDTVSWPACGEIDVMEIKGQQPSIVNGTIHGPGYSGANAISGRYALQYDRFDKGYHLFAIEWDADKIDFFVDGYLYQRIEKSDVPGEWVYDHPFFMILNVAVGGNYLGNPTNDTPFPQKMTIDYVRVYR
ncbi:glycoside hydrolase family 16 protein [Flavobacterium sp. CYK-4]|uniref:glycoside hydrolase family 16 protein n=1 Tax=Flavobacterium lotistagni TaxID=2709660 RepID=UPI00140C3091|nr:glycoside hydrolase family 16 protein [Flavobacterium lotistagni]NHM06814.1 glycoside hydrolase family 16 protein [Flavobacterium lotistagni]